MSKRDKIVGLLTRCGFRPRGSGDNISVPCPLAPYSPMHRHNTDSRPSMGIKVDVGSVLVNCFTCGFKARQVSSLFYALATHNKAWEGALAEARQIEAESLGEGLFALSQMGYSAPRAEEPVQISEDEFKPYGPVFHRYFETRGISWETGKMWGVGFDDERQRALIPVRDRSGALWGAVGRTVLPEAKPKYLNYFNMTKGAHLLGAHVIGAAKSIVVVEGGLDAMRASQAIRLAGLQDELACVSIMGATISDRQVRQLLAGSYEVIIALDADDAGDKGAALALSKISTRITTRIADMRLVGKKDFGECTDAEILHIIDGSYISVKPA